MVERRSEEPGVLSSILSLGTILYAHMKSDAIIFDLDGTLWDATTATVNGWNEALKVLGLDTRVTTADVRRVTGNPQEVCIEMLLPGMAEKYRNLYDLLSSYESAALREEGGELYEGVMELLPVLASRYPLFIVSNCEEWYLDLFFKKYGLKKYFKDADCFGKSKKAKSVMIAELLHQYHLKAALYVGDTDFDRKAANEAGVDFIFCAYGFGTVENSPASVHSFRELLPLA